MAKKCGQERSHQPLANPTLNPTWIAISFQFFQPEASRDRRGRPRRISRQKFPKRTRILSIPSKLQSFQSVHSAIGSRMNGMIFRSFRKWNSSQKNTNTVNSEYTYSGIVPKNAPCISGGSRWWVAMQVIKHVLGNRCCSLATVCDPPQDFCHFWS